uniref:Uncharacterized protein n=1 Tax=Manihot esculenta TaxID=3983 RepID=A0A2C9W4J8_MANES
MLNFDSSIWGQERWPRRKVIVWFRKTLTRGELTIFIVSICELNAVFLCVR